MSAMKGRPATAAQVVAWLEAMPAAERERVARLLADSATVAAIREVRATAVQELLAEPGATWQTVAGQLGVSTSTINKLVTAANAHRAQR